MMTHLLTNLSECVLVPSGKDETGDTGGGVIHHQGGELATSLFTSNTRTMILNVPKIYACGYHQFHNRVCANHSVQ